MKAGPWNRLNGGALRVISAFLLGAVCAVWILPVLVGPRMQRLRLERDAQRDRADLLREEVTKLTEALRKQQVGTVVGRARVQVEGPDQRVAQEAQRRLQKQLADAYVGRPVDEISSLVVSKRFHGRLLEIDGVRYQFDVDLVVIGPELGLYGVLVPVR